MKNINNFIIEKLHLNKDIQRQRYTPTEGDRIMTLNFLTGAVDCVLKVGIIKSIFRNTVVVKFDTDSIGVDTLYVLTDEGEYFGKSESGDLIFDKKTALKLVDKCLNSTNRIIYKNYNIVGSTHLNEYLEQIKESLLEEV